ncbi:hypothetical protein [Lujinxingia litoralis]|nr:hypothetical protein [Lujinxingia litoralis]
MKRHSMVWLAAGLFAMSGCGVDLVEDGPSDSGEVSSTGIALSFDYQGNSDVKKIKFLIKTCHGYPVLEEVRSLEDMQLPGMIPEFMDSPLDGDSHHSFADMFSVLREGCYHVKIVPLNKYGRPSRVCDEAYMNHVKVFAGQTTEVMLISQCEPKKENGAIDVIGVLNHPPVIRGVYFKKFNTECDEVKVCIAAYDPDGDPLKFKLEKKSGPKLLSEPRKIDYPNGDTNGEPDSMESYGGDHNGGDNGNNVGEVQCFKMRLGEAGDYEFKASVYDLLWEGDHLKPFGYDSKASLRFPIYAGEGEDGCCKPKKGSHDDD